MTIEERGYINCQIENLKIELEQARRRKDKMGTEGNWNHFYFWVGQIDQIKNTINLLNELLTGSFYE